MGKLKRRKDMKKYWLHRIKGGKNAMKLSHPLLFDHNILSTGWSELSNDDFIRFSNEEKMTEEFNIAFEEKYILLRNRWSLWRFLHMCKGDIVVIPTWDKFSIYEIEDDTTYTIKSLPSLISPDKLLDWNKQQVHLQENAIYDKEGNRIDLGFFRKVKPVDAKTIRIWRQSYANQALFSRMKVMNTNADITDIRDDVDDAISRAIRELPINIHDELIKTILEGAKKPIDKYIQHRTYEELVEKYLRAIGATEVVTPAPNGSRHEDGDADKIAYFDPLKLAVMVQIKKHNKSTNDEAVKQIIEYAKNNENEDYQVQLWVISNAETFTDEAQQKAYEANVRLIDGREFIQMMLDVGLRYFTLKSEQKSRKVEKKKRKNGVRKKTV